MTREKLEVWEWDEDLCDVLPMRSEIYIKSEVDQIFEEGYILLNSLRLAKLQEDPKKLKEAIENIEDYLESMRG